MENQTKTKKQWFNERTIEIIVAIFLGITALATAWASWIGSLHGGNQATNYATSNNLASEGNSEYNAAVQQMNQDMILWNDISDMQMEIIFAQEANDTQTVEKTCYQLLYKLDENLSETMSNMIGWKFELSQEEYDDPTGTILAWLENDESYKSPFFNSDYVQSYFDKANELLAESQATLERGQADNANGDAYGLATVIYSVVLFLLGIAGTFKHLPNRSLIVLIAIVGFLAATVYMFTLPMPTGFNFASFFAAR